MGVLRVVGSCQARWEEDSEGHGHYGGTGW